jgi:hypothetical protein
VGDADGSGSSGVGVDDLEGVPVVTGAVGVAEPEGTTVPGAVGVTRGTGLVGFADGVGDLLGVGVEVGVVTRGRVTFLVTGAASTAGSGRTTTYRARTARNTPSRTQVLRLMTGSPGPRRCRATAAR